jgi:hypothetical protein
VVVVQTQSDSLEKYLPKNILFEWPRQKPPRRIYLALKLARLSLRQHFEQAMTTF